MSAKTENKTVILIPGLRLGLFDGLRVVDLDKRQEIQTCPVVKSKSGTVPEAMIPLQKPHTRSPDDHPDSALEY